MKCAWNELLQILPSPLRQSVDRCARHTLQELRLRLDRPPELVCNGTSIFLDGTIRQEDLHAVVNAASSFSPWSAQTLSQGYITAPGGHRIGVCGEVVPDGPKIRTIRAVTSLNIRVARDITHIAPVKLPCGNLLILGPPGSGKTTLLRDIARHLARQRRICVVDERGELFPQGFALGDRMDVLSLCPKAIGIDMALRTMGADVIAVDEITSAEDCAAMIRAGWCGVDLIATAHAADLSDLRRRPVYDPLYRSALFPSIITMKRDKTWTLQEAVVPCTA